MNLNDKIPLEIEIGTLATLIAGLYVSYTSINMNAIPSSLFIEIAEQVSEYLLLWDYEVQSFEDWIKYNLIIAPVELFSEEELKEFRNYEVYIERRLGNATLIATGKVVT